jgi:hypothetical protein
MLSAYKTPRITLQPKKILRLVIPRKSSWIGCVSYVDRGVLKPFELVKKGNLEGLMVKGEDKYSQQTLWYRVLNPPYTQKARRQEFFQGQ